MHAMQGGESMSDDRSEAVKFADLEPQSFVRISGFDEEPSDWHVNNNFTIGAGPGNPLEGILNQFTADSVDLDDDTTITHGIVLQRADASEEWLAIIVEETSESIEVNHVAHMESPEDEPEPLEANLQVLETSQTKINLGDDE